MEVEMEMEREKEVEVRLFASLRVAIVGGGVQCPVDGALFGWLGLFRARSLGGTWLSLRSCFPRVRRFCLVPSGGSRDVAVVLPPVVNRP